MTREAWAKIPPEERRRRVAKSHQAMAVRVITERWRELTDDQQEAVLTVALELPEDAA
jgi:hypothetical protein